MGSKTNFSSIFAGWFIILVGLIFFNSGIFSIRNIVVTGNQTIASEDIIRATRLNLDKNIFQIDRAKIKSDILANPAILSVELHYQFPYTLEIRVRERQPFCLLMYRDNLLVLGEDGVIIRVKNDNEPIKLPVVSGIKVNHLRIGSRVVDPRFQTAQEIWRLADDYLRRTLSEIDLQDYQLYLDLPKSHHTLKVELGDANQLEEKIAKNLRSILSHTGPDELIKIDLRVPSIPTTIKNPG
ncbi:MAG TPA: FtsQ-type POTRA domain-containing protein [Bacillota bacterium]